MSNNTIEYFFKVLILFRFPKLPRGNFQKITLCTFSLDKHTFEYFSKFESCHVATFKKMKSIQYFTKVFDSKYYLDFREISCLCKVLILFRSRKLPFGKMPFESCRLAALKSQMEQMQFASGTLYVFF